MQGCALLNRNKEPISNLTGPVDGEKSAINNANKMM